jgi:hypothetical protein
MGTDTNALIAPLVRRAAACEDKTELLTLGEVPAAKPAYASRLRLSESGSNNPLNNLRRNAPEAPGCRPSVIPCSSDLGISQLHQPFRSQKQTAVSCVLLGSGQSLVTVLQFMEAFSDRQAADAVRARIDWKYSLLPLRSSPVPHIVNSPPVSMFGLPY